MSNRKNRRQERKNPRSNPKMSKPSVQEEEEEEGGRKKVTVKKRWRGWRPFLADHSPESCAAAAAAAELGRKWWRGLRSLYKRECRMGLEMAGPVSAWLLGFDTKTKGPILLRIYTMYFIFYLERAHFVDYYDFVMLELPVFKLLLPGNGVY